jgi:predicted transcriptional regulator
MNDEKKKTKKLYYSPPKQSKKWMVNIRFPLDIRNKLKAQAEKDYSGRGKQSILIEDAVTYYLYTIADLKWADYEKDQDYAELIDDIHEGINQKPLGGATQVFFSETIKDRILDIEKKIKLTNPLIKDVRTGLIRKAVSIRLTLGDKSFFDSIMGMEST